MSKESLALDSSLPSLVLAPHASKNVDAMSKARLEGKVAIITGGSSGVGEASARLFASNGAIVVIADIQDDLGEAVAASIGRDKCSYIHCDVTDETQVESMVKYAVTTYGRLDIMYSNAGILTLITSVLELDFNNLEKIMSVNVKGMALALKHAGRAMRDAGIQGSIICTASVGACQGGNGPASYVASKHAVLGLVRAAARDLGQYRIRVNCVSPSGMATGLSIRLAGKMMTPGQIDKVNGALCNLKGKALKPRHVADAALFLASDESAMISGHNLVVDGGNLAINSVNQIAMIVYPIVRKTIGIAGIVVVSLLLFYFCY